ncbi:MAG TPA: DUF883 C-terminal domain-containing protein [Hyphomicrobiaceae bacterium]|jgi:ElaB/YqjD/DUF883 family membrane-anchored ribosome-binding protein
MADPFTRNDPTAIPGASPQRTAEAGESLGVKDTADYQAEIEKLRSDMTRLAQSIGGTISDSMKPITRDLEAAVARNPTVSVAIAAGVGLVLGFLMSRR